MIKKRCEWAESDELSRKYHDDEWGVPLRDDTALFEMLILEGAQAGLSWTTVLKKRENYRRAFDGFDAEAISGYSGADIERLLKDPGIIRNRLKIESVVTNASAFLKVRGELGSFESYVWSFVGGSPAVNSWKSIGEIPASTPESTTMSRELKTRGFKFVGPTICYAFMQAVGMVNDHETSCFRYNEIIGLSKAGRP